jgi:hypothetical protein
LQFDINSGMGLPQIDLGPGVLTTFDTVLLSINYHDPMPPPISSFTLIDYGAWDDPSGLGLGCFQFSPPPGYTGFLYDTGSAIGVALQFNGGADPASASTESASSNTTPEPGTITLLAVLSGLFTIAAVRRRKL